MSFARGLKDLVTGFQNSGGTDAIYKAIERKRQESEFAKLVDALQNQSQTRTVEEKQQINNPLAQGITNPLMNAASQAFNPVQDITTQKEVPLSPQEIQRAMIEKLGQYYGQGGNNPMAGSLAQTYMPKQPDIFTLGKDQKRLQLNPDGTVKTIADNPSPIKPEKPTEQPDVTIDFKTLKDEKGKPNVYKIVSDKKTGETLSKTPQGEPDKVEGVTVNNYSGERLQFDKEKDNRTQKEKDVAGQGKYDSIMGSWDDKEQAYILNKGTKDEIRFKTDEEIQRFAEDYVNSEGYLNVKKWKHPKKPKAPDKNAPTQKEKFEYK